MTQRINVNMRRSVSSKTGHGHKTYTVDPCQYDSNLNIATKKYSVDLCVKDSNLNIATRHTMWIYATVQPKYTPLQPESVRKYSGSLSPPLYSTNLTMRIHVLKLNMVETT
jgi:hypothetical protein